MGQKTVSYIYSKLENKIIAEFDCRRTIITSQLLLITISAFNR